MIQATPTARTVTDSDADALVVTAFDKELSPAAQEVDAALGGALRDMVSSKEITGEFSERVLVPTLGKLRARRVLVLGLGKAPQLDSYRLHNAFHFAGAALRKHRVTSVTVMAGDDIVRAVHNGIGSAGNGEVARAVATGLALGNFDAGSRKSDPERLPKIERLEIGGLGTDGAVEDALREAVVLAAATNQVRAWAMAPSNTLTPTLLARSAEELYRGSGLEVDVLDKARLEREGCGALLGVARGSDEPPVMITARWDGGRPDGPRLALVGKGITFDTGGISIKPAANMELMKYDMGGGAAVLAAMYAIAQLKPACNVIGVVPATENMPGGRAYKPGDVLTSLSGKTIEVLNTDAEGRIILADGLAYARKLGATHIVDVATLTGACIVALGHVTAGLMSNNRALTAMVFNAAEHAGDRFTELPLHPEYEVCLRSDVADMKNVGGREGGAISAGIFLREFVGDTPWVHLDIAGVGWNDQGDLTVVPKGPSGAPVRTFVHLARAFASVAG